MNYDAKGKPPPKLVLYKTTRRITKENYQNRTPRQSSMLEQEKPKKVNIMKFGTGELQDIYLFKWKYK